MCVILSPRRRNGGAELSKDGRARRGLMTKRISPTLAPLRRRKFQNLVFRNAFQEKRIVLQRVLNRRTAFRSGDDDSAGSRIERARHDEHSGVVHALQILAMRRQHPVDFRERLDVFADQKKNVHDAAM